MTKKVTFNFFNYKWQRVPRWGEDTEAMYRTWYLTRYGYHTLGGLKKFLKDKASILEAGCGLARDSKMFAQVNPKAKVLAVDQSRAALAVAKKILKPFPNASVAPADITNHRFDRTFDFISCDQVLHHTPDPGSTLKHLFGYLEKGGVLNFFVCRKKNELRDFVDDAIMKHAQGMKPDALWKFSETVTHFGKALYDLGIGPVSYRAKKYPTLQRFVHDQVFRCWYNPTIGFDLSLSSNYDWFSGNPRFNTAEVKKKILGRIKGFRVLRWYEDDASISVSIQKL